MKVHPWLSLMAGVMTLATSAKTLAEPPAPQPRPAQATYFVYGRSLGDPGPPGGGDAKVALELAGPAARDLFRAMGPDRRDRCGAEPGSRFRSRDQERIVCTRSAKGEYRCQFGFDLATGKSIGGSIC